MLHIRNIYPFLGRRSKEAHLNVLHLETELEKMQALELQLNWEARCSEAQGVPGEQKPGGVGGCSQATRISGDVKVNSPKKAREQEGHRWPASRLTLKQGLCMPALLYKLWDWGCPVKSPRRGDGPTLILLTDKREGFWPPQASSVLSRLPQTIPLT